MVMIRWESNLKCLLNLGLIHKAGIFILRFQSLIIAAEITKTAPSAQLFCRPGFLHQRSPSRKPKAEIIGGGGGGGTELGGWRNGPKRVGKRGK